MDEKTISKVNYMLVGLGIGSVAGILFAPKSGAESRGYLAQKAREGSGYAQKKARAWKQRAENLVERGKGLMTYRKGQIAMAIDAGRKTYQREKSKVPGA